MSPDDLTRAIEAVRGYGWVVVDWRARDSHGAPSDAELEAYLATAGITGLGEGNTSPGGWREITDAEARHLVAHWSQHSLSYGRPPTGSGGVCSVIEPWFALFATAARCFTNTNGPASTPKTGHTFDAGVVLVDDHRIGAVWFADED